MNRAPIGLFDSGIGGLSVLQAIRRTLPNESIIYLADRAHLPYGSQSKSAIIDAALQCGSFLIENGVKSIIIACHTASIYALDTLQNTFSVPVFGLLSPSLEALAALSHPKKIAILGTEQTIRSQVYEKAVKKLWPASFCQSIACPIFVSLVEKQPEISTMTQWIVNIHLRSIKSNPPDSILLACTHFPFLKKEILQGMPSSLTLLDPANHCAKKVQEAFLCKKLETDCQQPCLSFFESIRERQTNKKLPFNRFKKLELNGKLTYSHTG